ncbi:hypothetical protein ACP70R_038714 [Stipagrostis hirtigluma subsp. patula]
MATVRALCLAVLLALCLAGCACDKPREPTNRYISYASPRSTGGVRPCNPYRPWECHAPGGAPGDDVKEVAPTTEGGAARTGAAGPKDQNHRYISRGALSSDQNPVPRQPGAKTGAAGPKGRYISRDALSKDHGFGWPTTP